MEFVVQNRSGQGLSGMVLTVDAGGTTSNYSIPLLTPGAISVIKLPVDQNQLVTSGGIVFRAQLVNPRGVVDQVPGNNRRTSALTPPSK
jgi:hypothetical protein